MSAVDAKAIRGRADNATRGPWTEMALGSEGYAIFAPKGSELGHALRRPRVALCGHEAWDVDRANAEFIAYARNDVPVLLDALEAVTAERDRLKAQVERVEAALLASDDGSEYEHETDCNGDANCPACWVLTIRNAIRGFHPVARCARPGCRNVGDADEPDVWATVDGETYCTEWHAFRCEGCDTDHLEADRSCPHQSLCGDCGHGSPCEGCAEDAHWDAAERAAEAQRDDV